MADNLIPKIDGMSIPLEFYRKVDGRTEKAVVTIRQLIDDFSVVDKFQDILFARYKVEEFELDAMMNTMTSRESETRLSGSVAITPETSEWLAEERKKAGKTGSEVIGETGFSTATLYSIESKTKTIRVSLENVSKYAKSIGLELEEILRRNAESLAGQEAVEEEVEEDQRQLTEEEAPAEELESAELEASEEDSDDEEEIVFPKYFRLGKTEVALLGAIRKDMGMKLAEFAEKMEINNISQASLFLSGQGGLRAEKLPLLYKAFEIKQPIEALEKQVR